MNVAVFAVSCSGGIRDGEGATEVDYVMFLMADVANEDYIFPP